MATLRCKKCGGDLEITENSSICECIYCGSKETIPNVDNERGLRLYDRANRLRMANEFDKAEGVYESIIEEFSEDAEAYWGLLLCKYGIEYVDDPLTGEKVPTCHRSSYESILDDNDFEMVMEFSDTYSRAVYRENAKKIDEIRRGIIEVSEKEKPYDIFICYKETSQTGERTVDSVIAQNVYNMLIEKGYRVFFSRITLEDKLGTEYEPYIFAALNSAKVMLAFGTDYDNYNAVWVKNEWSRFLKLMNKDKSKRLIPCYKDIDVSDIPKEFVNLQGQDMGKIGAEQDLLHGIQKILGLKKIKEERQVKSTAISKVNPTIDSYLKRVNIFIEDGNWEKADEYCEKVLDVEPECANAYLSKLLIDYKIKNMNEIKSLTIDCFDNPNFLKALKYADDELKTKFEEYICDIYFAEYGSDILQRCTHKLVEKLKKIVIAKGITGIGDYAFEGWEKIEEIQIPDSVITIGNHAFEGCESLTEIIIPDSVITIGNYAFKGCKSLKRIYIPDSVITIGNFAFEGCESLTEIIISESVTSIGDSAFEGCESLIEIIIPESVTLIGDAAFNGCLSLKKIKLPYSIKDFDIFMFHGCSSLREIESQWFTVDNGAILSKNKTNLISYLDFDEYKGRYSIPNGVISISECAFICSSLTEITIPDSMIKIGDSAFEECSSLKEIIIPDNVKEIGDCAFAGCESLIKIKLPNCINRIKSNWFDNCVSLKEVESPWFLIENKGVFNNERTTMFRYLNSCENTDIYCVPEGITLIDNYVFSGCTLLKEIHISDHVTTIGNHAFDGCEGLKKINIPQSVTTIGDSAFYGCSSLEEIIIPNKVTMLGNYVFEYCTSLKEIQISEGILTIGESAFAGCKGLKKINVPQSVTTIGDSAFYDCSSLEEIIIPESVISIGKLAFLGCSKIKKIVMPERFTSESELLRISLQTVELKTWEAITEEQKTIQEYEEKLKQEKLKQEKLKQEKEERLKKSKELQLCIHEKSNEIDFLNEELKSLFFLSSKKKELKERISILENEKWELERQLKRL